jgi:hypothetical protein
MHTTTLSDTCGCRSAGFKKKAAMKVEAVYPTSSEFMETQTTTARTLNPNATRPAKIVPGREAAANPAIMAM